MNRFGPLWWISIALTLIGGFMLGFSIMATCGIRW